MGSVLQWTYRILPFGLCLSLAACGYHFHGVTNPFHDAGIRKIYVQGFENNTFRPGLEQLFTSAMVKEIKKSQVFDLVDAKNKADAILTGTITVADANPGSTSAVTVGLQDQQVAAQYSASINCTITLSDPQGRPIYAQGVGKSKLYVGSILKGSEGATVPLTNESEQRLAYQNLAGQMMETAYQQMVDLF